ncbi:MAG: hypothetical protein QGG74_00660 [Phycisphaerales bacterium]|jgi:hypothetical protein|nr:hypothetical protein [Phycisphaerales bacterium]
MTATTRGLERFGAEVDQSLLERVRRWDTHAGLRGLLESLQSQKRRRRFFDLWVEAMVADRLNRAGCELETEVQTPAGRTCDFRVRVDDLEWYLHIKRLDKGNRRGRRLAISPRLRILEHIERPFIVRIRWAEGLDDELMQELVVRASTFLELAKIGDELTVRDESGLEIGAIRVVGPWEGRTVSLAIGLPDGFIDESARIRRLLDKAYRQFMPRGENVILVVGNRPDDVIDFEAALLGATEERWDAQPERGGHAAIGRAEDGFWCAGSRPESSMCGWCDVLPSSQGLRADLYFRDDPAPEAAMASVVSRLLNENDPD